MWRNDDLYVALWQMAPPGHRAARPGRGRSRAGKRAGDRCCPRARSCTAPGCSSRCRRSPAAAPSCSSTRSASTPRWSGTRSSATRVQVLTIVGDVFARPLLDALDAEPDRWDLSSLRAITSSGVTWSPEVKRGLLEHLPERHADRLARRVRRAHDAHRPPSAGDDDRAGAVRGQRPRRGARRDDGARGRARERRGRAARRRRPHPARLLQGPGEDRGDVPRRRRRPLLDPRRLRDRRRRRHDPAARPRLGVHQHRRREGVPRGGRARRCASTRRRSTAWSSASPTSASARWWSRSCSSPDGTHRRGGAAGALQGAGLAGYKIPPP